MKPIILTINLIHIQEPNGGRFNQRSPCGQSSFALRCFVQKRKAACGYASEGLDLQDSVRVLYCLSLYEPLTPPRPPACLPFLTQKLGKPCKHCNRQEGRIVSLRHMRVMMSGLRYGDSKQGTVFAYYVWNCCGNY